MQPQKPDSYYHGDEKLSKVLSRCTLPVPGETVLGSGHLVVKDNQKVYY